MCRWVQHDFVFRLSRILMNKEKHKLLLCLGSNFQSEEKVSAAKVLLEANFSNLRFSDARLTAPLNMQRKTPFLNQLVVAETDKESTEVRRMLKAMERELGRTEHSKSEGIIPIDIDLLEWDSEVIHSEIIKNKYFADFLF